MFKSLRLLLENLFGDSVARMLQGAGLSLATTAALLPLLTGALSLAASKLGGLPGDVLSLVGLSGVGEALSIIGSAMLTRFAMGAASVGIRKASS